MKINSAWKILQKHRFEVILVGFILLLSFAIRIYHINEYMQFLGDEGRDAIIVKKMVTQFYFPFIGPQTSVGNMYLGPLYYYMMAVSFILFGVNPISAAVMIAILTTITVGLIYYLGRSWFGMVAGVVASVGYAISPVNIIYGHSSWNPNPVPFFTLLGFLGLYRLHKTHNFRWSVLMAIALAFAVQMHYLAVVLMPIYAVLWLVEFRQHRSKLALRWLLISIGAFCLLMSPLLLFDLKHNFMNIRALLLFFGDRQTTVNLNFFNTLLRLPSLYFQTFISRYMTGNDLSAAYVIGGSVLLAVSVGLIKWWKTKVKPSYGFLVVSFWFLFGLAGLSLYKQTVYDHYLGYLNPAPYIILGAIVQYLTNIKFKIGLVVGLGIFGIVVYLNVLNSPLLRQPNNQLPRTIKVTKYIIEQADNKPFNFALLSEHNYDAAYQYFLTDLGHTPAVAPMDKTDQLFVVCEDKVCPVINNPKYEIAAWGWARIESEVDYEGVKVFKLAHNY